MRVRLTIALLAMFLGACADPVVGQPFVGKQWLGDADQWHANTGVDVGVRLPMAERLVASRALVGKTFADLQSMLGAEDPSVIQCPGFGSRWFGSAWGLGPGETRFLEVQYGDGDRVTECRIH